jgi:hypothetical protein
MAHENDPHGEAPGTYYDAEGHDDLGVYGDFDEAEIVEWYEARPLTVSTAAATGSVIGAFALGVLTTLAIAAIVRRHD